LYTKDALLKQRTQLSVANQALLEKRLRGETDGTVESQLTIPRRSEQGPAPLSFSQQRLWLLHRLEPSSVAFNAMHMVRLVGQLDLDLLRRSHTEIMRRHDVLRTTFAVVDGEPVQVVQSRTDLPSLLVDLCHLRAAEREVELQRLVGEEKRRPFDLARDLPWRNMLIRLAPDEHIILSSMHHITFDGWSMSVFDRELITSYATLVDGKSSSLPTLPIQYADFAAWQRKWLQGHNLERLLGYWRKQLDGLETLQLFTDRSRPPMQTDNGAEQVHTLSRTLTEAVKAFSQRENVTTFVTLLAAFKTLLHRYTDQTDIVVGSVVAGRNRPELEGLIGYFLNNLVMRTDLSGDPTFRTLVGRVNEMALEALAHQDLPFEYLVDELETERDMSRNALFQVLFIWQNVPKTEMEWANLQIESTLISNDTAKLDITLFMEEKADGIESKWEYNTDLFDHATIVRMAHHLRTLLANAMADPDQRLSELSILTEAEREQIHAWNDTRVELPYEKSIAELVQDQVARTPHVIAVSHDGEQLTFRQLNKSANRLARALVACGVGPGVVVAVLGEQGVGLLIAILAISKTGGAYLPLDPRSPALRLTQILGQSKAPFVLTTGRFGAILSEAVANLEERPLVLDWENLGQEESSENLPRCCTPDDLAYVIYTSGSTGQPKGVMISQQALAQYVMAATDHFAITSDDCVLQFASISFDTAAEEIYPCLLSGARLVLRTDTMLDSVETFLRTCAANDITVLDLPTAYWHAIVAELELNPLTFPPSLRLVIIGGEAASPARLRTWQAHAPAHIHLVNTYGPTETTIVATMCDLVGENALESAAKAPIGKSVANTQAYVLDPHLRLVPVGVPGELHIGGSGLAWGYMNQPDLTAESFIPNSFSNEPGTRLYKTGDLARYLADGNIEFLGRLDHQVKIRGFRIELGEVEARLVEHPAVRETVVTARRDTPDEKYLVAYIVTEKYRSVAVSELRSFLQQRLPDYMVPSIFVPLDTLPLTPSGKVDRRTLPAPERTRSGLEKALVAPRTASEELLAEIWSQVLGVDRVGVYDSFFELGGHSMLAIRLMARIQDAFQVELSLRLFFERPTIAELAVAIDEILLEEIETLSEEEALRLLESEF
jgi:amino acid adenylation domain-containing protein